MPVPYYLLIKKWYFAYKWILSISGYWLIKLNIEFAFPYPELPIINIVHGWSGICGQF